jgi:hypothetical protein
MAPSSKKTDQTGGGAMSDTELVTKHCPGCKKMTLRGDRFYGGSFSSAGGVAATLVHVDDDIWHRECLDEHREAKPVESIATLDDVVQRLDRIIEILQEWSNRR